MHIIPKIQYFFVQNAQNAIVLVQHAQNTSESTVKLCNMHKDHNVHMQHAQKRTHVQCIMSIVTGCILLYNGIIKYRKGPVVPGTVRDMKESFFERVLREKIVDTRKYRYTLQETCLFTDIVRLPIEYLDTYKAYEPWEVVCSYAKQITAYDD